MIDLAPPSKGRLEGYRLAWRKIGPPIFLGLLPVVVVVWAIVLMIQIGNVAFDFHHELYPEAKLVLHGSNPYPAPDADLSSGTNTIWPIAALLPALPLTPLRPGAADGVMTAFVIVAFVMALLVLGVRDWRVVGLTFLWPPVIAAFQTANLTLPLILLAALVWRHRERRWIAGGLLGLALAAKFFLWPLVPFLFAIRRRAAAALACLVALASLGLMLPFISLGDYFQLIRNLSNTFDGKSYTVYGFLTDAGVNSSLARVAMYAVGLSVLTVAVRWRSFSLATGAALALSPIVWLHYFAFLAVPLAIASPTLAWPWFLPLLMIVAPGNENGRPWQSALVLLVTAVTIGWCARQEQEGARVIALRPLTS